MRMTEVWHAHVDGQLIRTTGEHPFYDYDKGWTPAQELTPKDWILTSDGHWKPVNEIWNTGDLETVYNLRVADHHTYFVGEEHWGWSAWVHNNYYPPVHSNEILSLPSEVQSVINQVAIARSIRETEINNGTRDAFRFSANFMGMIVETPSGILSKVEIGTRGKKKSF